MEHLTGYKPEAATGISRRRFDLSGGSILLLKEDLPFTVRFEAREYVITAAENGELSITKAPGFEMS